MKKITYIILLLLINKAVSQTLEITGTSISNVSKQVQLEVSAGDVAFNPDTVVIRKTQVGALRQVYDSAKLNLRIGEHEWNLDLKSNRDIYSNRSKSFHLNEDGLKPDLKPTTVELFKGTLAGQKSSFVRMTLFEDNTFKAFISDNGVYYFLRKMSPHDESENSVDESVYLFYSSLDIQSDLSCGMDEQLINSTQLQNNNSLTTLSTGPFLIEFATEADYEYYQEYGSSTNAEILSVLNEVEAIYQQYFDVYFSVIHQQVLTSSSNNYSNTDASTLLSEFRTNWNTNYSTIQRDLVHLFTGKNLNGNTIGYAYIGVLCSQTSGYGLSEDWYSMPTLVAHEIGHNLDGRHQDAINCGNAGSIMCPIIQSGSTYFSSTTISKMSSELSGTCVNCDVALYQNQTYTGSNMLSGCVIILDEISVSSGSLILQPEAYVEIQEDFDVASGSVFEID